VFFPIEAHAVAVENAKEKGAKKSRAKKTAVEAKLPSDAMKARLFDLRKRGFNRLFQNGQVFEFSTPESLLDVNFSVPVFGLVDRLVVARTSARALSTRSRSDIASGRSDFRNRGSRWR